MKKEIFIKIILAVSVSVLVIFFGGFIFSNALKRNRTVSKIDTNVIQDPVKYITSPDITAGDLNYYISVLASDSLEGREAETIGEQKAIDFICEKFSDYGLKCHIQPFTFLKVDKTYYDCFLSFENFQGEIFRDFIPILPVDSSKASGEVVFIGYGYDYSKNGKTFNDYKEIDVRNKWVMIFEGNYLERIIPKTNQSLEERYEIAQKNGAIGLLTIHTGSASNGELVMRAFSYSMNNNSKYLIPLIRISEKTADKLFKYADSNTRDALKNCINKQWNIQIPVKVHGSVNTRNDSLSSNNIIAYMEGTDSILKNEYILVGAHYDHLGKETFPTLAGDSSIIYYGADDNASGTAGVMELAEKLVSAGGLKRSLIFVLFGAEEQHSMQGSRYFCENFPVPPDKIKLMINLDMIGRMDSLKNVFVKTDTQNSILLKKAGIAYADIRLDIDTKNVGKSDHLPFVSKKIPIAYFTIGTHPEYHTPKDNISSINYSGEKQLLDLIYDFIVLRAETVKK